MEADVIYEVVKKLIGNVYPAGESHTDEKRFENLELLCEVTQKLVSNIDQISHDYKDVHQASVKKAGEYAQNFLNEPTVYILDFRFQDTPRSGSYIDRLLK